MHPSFDVDGDGLFVGISEQALWLKKNWKPVHGALFHLAFSVDNRTSIFCNVACEQIILKHF